MISAEVCVVDNSSYKSFATVTPGIAGGLTELSFYSILDTAKDPTAKRNLIQMFLDKDGLKKLSTMIDAVA
jgi:hypothetical protein